MKRLDFGRLQPRLAAVQKRLQARAVLAVTLESAQVTVDVVRRESGASRAVQSFTLPLGAEAVVAAPEKAGVQLLEQLTALNIRERRCVVCLPPGWALTTSTDLPAVSPEDLRGYLELRAEREFPVPVSDLRLAHCAYALPDGTRRATLTGVPAKRVEAVSRMLETAGCRAVSMSLGLDPLLPPPGQAGTMHFLANGNHVDLVIAAGGGIAALRCLNNHAAEGAAFDAATFSREVRITLGSLPDAVRQQVREAHFGGAQPAAEILRREVEGPLQRFGIASRAEESAVTNRAAVKAADLYLGEEPAAFEFIERETPRWQALFQRFDSRRRRLAVGAAGALLVLPLLVFLGRSRYESGLEREWDGMRKNVAELETVQQKIRQFRPWFEPAPQSLQVLEGLFSAFPEPGDVWAKSIQLGEAGKVTCAGFARNQAALEGFLDRLRSRPDVAGLTVPQVRGVPPALQFTIIYTWEGSNNAR